MNERFIKKVAFLGFGLSGIAALVYEVSWTRSLTNIMGSSTYVLSTILASFMAGLSFGGFLGARISRRKYNPVLVFAFCELAIGLSGMVIVPIIKALMPLYIDSFFTFRSSFDEFSLIQFLLIFLILGIPTTFMGITFPIIINYMTSGRNNEASDYAGRLYSINTLGAIAGTLAAGFMLIPLIGASETSLVAASLNIMTAMVLIVLSREYRRALVAAAVVFVMVSASITLDKPLVPFFSYYWGARFPSYEVAKSAYEYVAHSKEMKDFIAYEHEGLNGNVYLTKSFESPGYTLVNNGKLERGDEVGFKLLADLPYFTHGPVHSSVKALNIGLGSGNTLSELATLPIDQITSVELSKGVLEANRRFLTPELFNNPKITHVQADGRNFLTVDKEKFDIIVASPSWAVEQGSADLLTDEFFELASSQLHSSGVFAVWVDYFLMDDSDMDVVMETFARHFKSINAWYIEGDGVVLVGTKGSPVQDKQVYASIISQYPQLDGKFFAMYSDDEILKLPRVATNTDDDPIIEFQNAKHIITGHSQHAALQRQWLRHSADYVR